MVYDLKTAPKNTLLWCVGFRFDETKAGIKCPPIIGTIKEYKFYPEKNSAKVILVGSHSRYYRFADTYEEAANEYNGMIFAAKYELMKKQQYLDGCLLADKNGSVYSRVSMQ